MNKATRNCGFKPHLCKITSLIILIWGVVNQTKVFYRDDVVKFEDLGLIKEALIMAQRCDVIIKWYTVVVLIFIILIFLFTRRKIKKLSVKFVKRVSLIILLLVLAFLGYKNIYKNKDIYDSVGDTSLINIWIATRQSQIRGLIYPFIYTLQNGADLDYGNIKAPMFDMKCPDDGRVIVHGERI